ncbi:two-component system regulatory protein YycI [Sporolactobacillus pectinivorans]|uniref:two-component system regulatory protein YycI n=1 Tax=Sporolactobacillus pectinivorans TaxID=1591408 RepID=UPI000C26AB39|nr:two-component system regulatory protein YycI [Sporolactobacillus pectinivorans]
MNWSKTKSIFIVCFLLLDAFLIFELYARQQDEGVENLTDGSGTNNTFRVDTTIPPTPQNVTFLRGSRVNFSNEKKNIADLTSSANNGIGQKIQYENGGMQLHGIFASPISGNMTNTDLQKIILGLVYKGQSYTYWQNDSKARTINFVQLYNNQPVFISRRNNIQMLEFTVSQNKIVGYQQSYFKFSKSNYVDVISAEKAISNLGENTDLLDSERPVIKTVELGYVNLVGDASADPLIFIPTWHIVVQTNHGDQEYFVNAMSGNVQTLD